MLINLVTTNYLSRQNRLFIYFLEKIVLILTRDREKGINGFQNASYEALEKQIPPIM